MPENYEERGGSGLMGRMLVVVTALQSGDTAWARIPEMRGIGQSRQVKERNLVRPDEEQIRTFVFHDRL